MKDLITIFLAAIVDLVAPILMFIVGFVGGIVLQWAFGDSFISGLNLLFNTSRFAPDMIPVVCGSLSVIGYYFKATLTTRKE